ncbi:Retrovirus-related Pol polyprotein, partial [Aphis craccivora]
MASHLDFITALRFISEFTDGNETDLASFIARCDFVFSKIPDTIKSDILDAVLTQLKGKAFDAYLQAQLSLMTQGPKEMIKDFSQRIEKTYPELTLSHASSVFISGVSQTIQIILLARNITSFEEAIFIGMEQEKTFGTEGKTSKIYERNNKNNSKEKFNKTGEKIDKSKIKCFRCDKMGHCANE